MKTMENNTCLYMHVKPESKEAFYIGVGNAKRPYDDNKRSKWWNRVVSKYGYDVVILSDNLSWEDACKIEIDLIKYFGRKDLGEGSLVNMTDGGEGLKNPSAETRAKISAAHKGKIVSEETKSKISAANIGKKHSAETKAKISNSVKGDKNGFYGNKHSEEAKAKMGLANKGNKYNVGKVPSAETRAKLAKSNGKLTESQVIDILIEFRDNPHWGQIVNLANTYGVTAKSISHIKNNIRYKHINRETI
jgi:hypothetical protein